MDGRRSLAEIATLLCTEYDVGAGTAAGDLLRFVDQLSGAGLIELASPRDSDAAPAA
jgi:hypothetical protein